MYKKGLRCEICTGCGQCPGVYPVSARKNPGTFGSLFHILTEGGLEEAYLKDGGRERDVIRGEGIKGGIIAADIGTTTIAMALYGEDGRQKDCCADLNPQAEYGADVISRIQAAQNKEAAFRMQEMVSEVLKRGVDRFRRKLCAGDIPRIVIAANTAMTYLFLGRDPAELGRAPFHVSFPGPEEILFEGFPCLILPALSAFVGGDITAGIYAGKILSGEDISLLIDLGTNAEMVLGSKGGAFACAAAAGPAFEGGANRGIWGADMVSLTARLRRERLLDETGLLAEKYFDGGIRSGNVHITQQSVRSIQLAKGAIAAGIRILKKKAGISAEQIKRVVLAGGFGYYLEPEDAAEIGLLPGELAGRTVSGGNLALTGAGLAGAYWQPGKNTEELLEEMLPKELPVTLVNLAGEPDFEKIYLESMGLEKF